MNGPPPSGDCQGAAISQSGPPGQILFVESVRGEGKSESE